MAASNSGVNSLEASRNKRLDLLACDQLLVNGVSRVGPIPHHLIDRWKRLRVLLALCQGGKGHDLGSSGFLKLSSQPVGNLGHSMLPKHGVWARLI
jgi:hypothetical protein